MGTFTGTSATNDNTVVDNGVAEAGESEAVETEDSIGGASPSSAFRTGHAYQEEREGTAAGISKMMAVVKSADITGYDEH